MYSTLGELYKYCTLVPFEVSLFILPYLQIMWRAIFLFVHRSFNCDTKHALHYYALFEETDHQGRRVPEFVTRVRSETLSKYLDNYVHTNGNPRFPERYNVDLHSWLNMLRPSKKDIRVTEAFSFVNSRGSWACTVSFLK